MILAHPSNYRLSLRATYERVVVHITDGHSDPVATAEMWQEPDHKSSAHFVVGQSGAVIQCVRLKDVAFHAHTANETSVGIEHCARTPGELGPHDLGLPLSEVQYSASAKLTAWLCRAANLPLDRVHILGHAEADPLTTHTKCPLGAGWDWEIYMQLVRESFFRIASF